VLIYVLAVTYERFCDRKGVTKSIPDHDMDTNLIISLDQMFSYYGRRQSTNECTLDQSPQDGIAETGEVVPLSVAVFDCVLMPSNQLYFSAAFDNNRNHHDEDVMLGAVITPFLVVERGGREISDKDDAKAGRGIYVYTQ
jgi:hypothetical protein